MKVLAPLNSFDNLEKYIECGADEFYLGYEDQEWEERFSQYDELNKMSSIKGSDIAEWHELDTVIKKIKTYGVPVYITLNCFSYTDEQLDFLDKRLSKLSEMDIDGIITGAPELIPLILKHNIKVHVSSMANVYNKSLVDYYTEQKVDRIILPRDLNLNEIESIVKQANGTDIEVFLMRVGCRFSDPNCLCLHGGKYGGICGYLGRAKRKLYTSKMDFNDKHDYSLNNLMYEQFFHKSPACGLCSIWKLIHIGVTSCKIVGRYENPVEVAEDIRLAKENIQIAKECNSEIDFLKKMKTHTQHKIRCLSSMGCYYPESRF